MMKNYKFKVKKIITNTVELQAENYKEALTYLLEVLEMWDREIFENSDDKKVDYDIILDRIRSKNDAKNLKEIRKILKKIEENTEEIIENNTNNNTKKINENDTEYIEIICNKCGNCIELNTNFMS